MTARKAKSAAEGHAFVSVHARAWKDGVLHQQIATQPWAMLVLRIGACLRLVRNTWKRMKSVIKEMPILFSGEFESFSGEMSPMVFYSLPGKAVCVSGGCAECT